MTDESNTYNLKSKWNLYAVTGVVIFAELVTFITAPPQLRIDADSKIDWFVKFLIAGIIALLAIPMLKKSGKTDYSFWYRFSWISLILSVIVLGLYTLLVANWSVHFYNGKMLVIGKSMTPEAQEQKQKVATELNLPMVDDEILVKARKGQTQFIWPQQELQTRYFVLSIIYIICFLLFALFMLSVIQAVYCYEKKT